MTTQIPAGRPAAGPRTPAAPAVPAHRPTPAGVRPVPHTPPPLGWWQRTWRYLLAGGAGLVLWVFTVVEFMPDVEAMDTPRAGLAASILLADLLLGVLALCLLPLRRRFPALAGVLAALTAFSTSAVGPAALATVSMATLRRVPLVVGVGAVWVATALAYEWLVFPGLSGRAAEGGMAALAAGLALGVYAALVATGYYVGARRELFASWQERARTAEREHALGVERVRVAERNRIAREMHDVLAHRISLVAMHAGALAYRQDMSPAETSEAAGVIRDNAHLALEELRQVLGVLRADGAGAAGAAEPPQPTLAELPALVADAEEAGTAVLLDTGGLPGGEPGVHLPELTSRTAFRIVQEALTNARKHAPGAAVTVVLSGTPGGRLEIEVRNPAGGPGRPGSGDDVPGAGLGLVGLTERTELVGGALEHGYAADGGFVMRAWLPWQS